MAKLNSQYSTITGNLFQDVNLNCTKDLNEKPVQQILVAATKGINTYNSLSDEQGNYRIAVFDTGKWEVRSHLGNVAGRFINQTCPAGDSALRVYIPAFGIKDTISPFGFSVHNNSNSLSSVPY